MTGRYVCVCVFALDITLYQQLRSLFSMRHQEKKDDCSQPNAEHICYTNKSHVICKMFNVRMITVIKHGSRVSLISGLRTYTYNSTWACDILLIFFMLALPR